MHDATESRFRWCNYNFIMSIKWQLVPWPELINLMNWVYSISNYLCFSHFHILCKTSTCCILVLISTLISFPFTLFIFHLSSLFFSPCVQSSLTLALPVYLNFQIYILISYSHVVPLLAPSFLPMSKGKENQLLHIISFPPCPFIICFLPQASFCLIQILILCSAVQFAFFLQCSLLSPSHSQPFPHYPTLSPHTH